MESSKKKLTHTGNASFRQQLQDVPLGSTILLYRQLQGLSLAELSHLSGIDVMTLLYIEKDLIRPVDDIRRICHHVGVPYEIMLTNALLARKDFDDETHQDVASLLQPLIHQLTKFYYIRNNHGLDELAIPVN